MNNSQAQALTAKLLAAYPAYAGIDQLTVEVYREIIETFPSYDQALETVNDLIRSEAQRPPVSLIVERYGEYAQRRREKLMQLDYPEPTPEEKAENIRMAREWQESVDAGVLLKSMP